MQLNIAIAMSAMLVMNGKLTEATPNQCLRLVREVVEHALELPPWGFYELFWTHRVEENITWEPWARDLERSLRAAGYAVYDPIAGDLVFNYRVARPYGHAGVMISDNLVLHSWSTPYGRHFELTPVDIWAPTTIIRLPDSLGP